jgi:hypothetical protein
VRPYRSLDASENVAEIVRRLGALQPTSVRQWGTMTPHEMLCHLGDSFESVLGERQSSPVDTWLSRTVMKWVAVDTPLPWPHGVQTRPEVDPKREGTKPVEFERDRQRVRGLLHRFAASDTSVCRHPVFGTMTRGEWLRWGYGHCDHHLRQFGV